MFREARTNKFMISNLVFQSRSMKAKMLTKNIMVIYRIFDVSTDARCIYVHSITKVFFVFRELKETVIA